jgi:hypothetical protein
MENFYFFDTPRKKYDEAFHETLSSMSFGSLAERGANQNPVYPGIYVIVPGLLQSRRN